MIQRLAVAAFLAATSLSVVPAFAEQDPLPAVMTRECGTCLM